MDSILSTIKRLLSIDETSTDFDQELIVFINSAMGILHMFGVGSATVYSITDKTTTWTQFLGASKDLELVKSYIYMKVRLVFDPPTPAYVLTAFQEAVSEYEFRLSMKVENAAIDARPIPSVDEGE